MKPVLPAFLLVLSVASIPALAQRQDVADSLPVYLKGLDLSIPAQATFEQWPSTELYERSYHFPWSGAAFQRASLFHRPVFLLMTVNWNRESRQFTETVLQQPDILRAINGGFISVVVNADLRPDLKERYQTGTWPVVAFLLPNGRPMLSQANDLGVAKPITSTAIDQEGLEFLLREGAKYWGKWPDLLMEVGDVWTQREGPLPPQPGRVDGAASDQVANWLQGNADRLDGGFGVAPKYHAGALQEYVALRAARGLPALAAHARFTLESLVRSPLFDSEHGGIHRFAAAPSYGQVQQEKMLVGNAELIRSLVVSLRAAPSEPLENALRSTAGFILRNLSDPDAGYYLAQNSGTEPAVDRIILSGPNAMAGAAMIRAGIRLGDPTLVTSGRRAIDRVLAESYRAGRGVVHSIRPRGEPRVYLGPQAEVALGLLDAHESTGEPRYLEAARDIVDFTLRNLREDHKAALRDHFPDARPIGLLINPRRPLRPNVRLARALVRLAHLDQGEAYRQDAKRILEAFSGEPASFGLHGIETGLAVEEWSGQPLRIRLHGTPSDPRATELRQAALHSAYPWVVIVSEEIQGKKSASAVIEWGEARRRVRDPDALQRAVQDLTGSRGDG